MKIYKNLKGIAVGTSLAAFVTMSAPAVGNAADLLSSEKMEQTGDKAKKKGDNKDEGKKEGEGKCGEGKCGEGKKKEGEGKCGEGKCGE